MDSMELLEKKEDIEKATNALANTLSSWATSA
jgi:hypothetical protein